MSGSRPVGGELIAGRAPSEAGAQIAYAVRGAGPPVVLVAGLADDRSSWDAVVPALASTRTVVTLDNRGSGESSTPAGPYSIAQMADDAHTVVRHLGLGPVTAIGSSMGGAICQRWALRHPDDLDRLVLSNTWGERDPFCDALFAHWISLAGAGSAVQVLESLLVFCFSPRFLRERPTILAECMAVGPPELDGFAAAAWACRGHDLPRSATRRW